MVFGKSAPIDVDMVGKHQKIAFQANLKYSFVSFILTNLIVFTLTRWAEHFTVIDMIWIYINVPRCFWFPIIMLYLMADGLFVGIFYLWLSTKKVFVKTTFKLYHIEPFQLDNFI